MYTSKIASISLLSLLSFPLLAETNECSDYQLVWQDEFNYTGLPDPSKWTYEEGYVRNKEMQYYERESLANTEVKDGYLSINALFDPSANPAYTSASITTQGKASWRYGKIEVSASIPTEKGMWPAIWMLGDNIRKVNWPRSGEIDIMEHVSKHPGRIHFNTVYYDYENKKKHKANGGRTEIDNPNEFNTFAIEWDKDKIDFLVNGKISHTFNTNVTQRDKNPFHKPQFLLLNLAVGGWGGIPNLNSFPASFKIDFVRVYQKQCGSKK
ncbi:glycoside hydrolase family 16 protein [Vibrio paucivorans]